MKIQRKSLHDLTRFFDGEGGAAGGGDAGGGAGQAQAGTGAATTGLPAAFNAREHLGDDGAFKADWWKAAGVSENVGKKFTRPEALARSYESLEAQIGKKGVIVPGPNATQAERDAYYTALGRPAKPEEYGFAKPDKIKLGDREVAVPDLAWDANRAKSWQQFLFENGASKEMANKIMMKATEESVTAFDGMDASREQIKTASRAALVKEFGGEEGYKTQMSAASRAAEQFGGKELMDHPGLANDPIMIRTLAKIGAAIGENPGKGTREQAGHNQLSRADASIEANKLTQIIAQRTKENRNWGNTAEAAQMKARKSELFKQAHPE